MNCSEVQGLMSAYFDGELASGTREQVRTHLESCSLCSQELVGFDRLSQLASQMTLPKPASDLWDQSES